MLTRLLDGGFADGTAPKNIIGSILHSCCLTVPIETLGAKGAFFSISVATPIDIVAELHILPGLKLLAQINQFLPQTGVFFCELCAFHLNIGKLLS